MATQIYWSREYNNALAQLGEQAPEKGKYLSPEFGEWVSGNLTHHSVVAAWVVGCETDRVADGQTDRQMDGQTERERERESARLLSVLSDWIEQRERERERERQRQRERERAREGGSE